MRRFFLILFILFIITAIFLLSPPEMLQKERILKIRDSSGVIIERKVEDGDKIVLTFINSVENKPVYEVYEVRDGGFILREIIYQAHYVGYIYEKQVPLTKTITLIPRINETYRKISFFYGWIGNHTIYICSEKKFYTVDETEDKIQIVGKVVKLGKYIKSGTLVDITTE